MNIYKSTICSNNSISTRRAKALLAEKKMSEKDFVPMFETKKTYRDGLVSHKVTFYKREGDKQ